LEHGADYETKNSDGEPLLVLSARDGALEILTQLKTRADIDLKKHTSKKYGENILFVAIRNGNLEYVKYLLENLADVFSNINPLDGKLALLENFKRSCAEGNLLDVCDFIEKKVVDPKDPQFLENNGLTPLVISIMNNHMELVKYLVEECFVDVNIKDKKYGYTPAISAIFESNLEALKYLKEKGADLTLCDNSKLTPVYYALLFRALDIFSYLLELPEIKETISLEGAFKIALDYGGEEVVRYLESRMNLTEEPLEQFRRAILKKDLELVTSLLEEKEVDSSDLIYAAKYSNLDILEVLLKKSKNVDLEDSDGATPLKRILSEKKINWKAVKLFLEHGADYETKNSAGESLLVLSARDGALEILTQLKTRADIDFKKHTSKDGENILYVAIKNRQWNYVKYLLEENLFSQDDNVLAKGTCLHKVLVQNRDPLSYAFYFGSFNIVRYLFDFQQKKNIGTVDLHRAMMKGIERGSYGIFSYMISKGASFDFSLSVEGVSFTPLSFSRSPYVKKNSLIIQTLEKIEEQFSFAREGKLPTEIIFPEATDSFGSTYLDYYRAAVQAQELPAPPAKANCCEIL
jgi:ankyrin repeat protein